MVYGSKIAPMISKNIHFGILALLLLLGGFSFAHAQDDNGAKAKPKFFEATVRPSDAVTFKAGKSTVRLWGVQAVQGMPAQFYLNALTTIEGMLEPNKVRCEFKGRKDDEILAQCTNAAQIDLGLHMLQQGYATVNRDVIYDTVYEQSYLNAEKDARIQNLGVWKKDAEQRAQDDKTQFYIILGGFALLLILGVFTGLAYFIIRGFKSVTEAQNQNTDMIARERELRLKERQIFATMLDSEIKANKSKIEAYLIVYDEMLRDLKDTEKPPKYKVAGDIVQAQPSLERSVFDRNTDKLDILGDDLSSDVVHFYARIKNKPDYINLEPDLDLEEATAIVQKSYDNAVRLDQISDRLIDLFSQGGHSSEDH